MTFIRNLLMAFVYAAAGIRTMMRQRNPRIHLLAAVVVCIWAAEVRVSRYDWAILVLAMGLVFVAEAINTAIEAVVDLLSPEYRPAAKVAKDVAAGAVLLAAIAAVVIGALVFSAYLK